MSGGTTRKIWQLTTATTIEDGDYGVKDRQGGGDPGIKKTTFGQERTYFTNPPFNEPTETGTLLAGGDNLIVVDGATGGVFDVTLPTLTENAVLWIKKVPTGSSNTIRLTPASGDRIEGGAIDATFVLDSSGSTSLTAAPAWRLRYKFDSLLWIVYR